MAAYELNRRSFLVSAALGGGLAVGFHLPPLIDNAHANDRGREINAWIVIRPDDTVVIRVARSEMGQGIMTALPMLVAEELDCDWTKIASEYAPPSENLRRNRVWGDMSTNASRSVAASQKMLRTAGAAAREMLIAAAAQHWEVPATECSAAKSVITHHPTGRTITFGAVADGAASLQPPSVVKLKEPSEWKLIGTPQRRLDVRAKVEGKPVYGIDVRVPGMLYAAIVQCPVFQGRLRSVDGARAMAMKGVRQVVTLPDAVAVVADGWWQANLATEALSITWDERGNGQASSDATARLLRDDLNAAKAGVGRRDGDVETAMRTAVTRIMADYSVPYLAHAPMEPQNCTARVANGQVEVWVPTQDGEAALANAADAAGVPRRNVVVHKTMLGGGFGRRGPMQDFVRQAVLIAKEVGQPVQLLWSREQDMRHDFYRPPAMARMTAGLDAAGMPIAWKIRIAGQSIVASLLPDMASAGVEPVFFGGLAQPLPYAVPNIAVEYTTRNAHVPIGVLRGVYQVPNVFFRECFIDEMADAAGQDPYSYRRKLCAANPRACAVLDAAAAKAGWSSAPPPGVFRGIALDESADTVCAQVIEASVNDNGAIRIHRVVAAIDPGIAVNPLTIEQQVQGAIVFGIAAALHGEINVRDGGVVESNFHDYEMLRMADMPRVETVILSSGGVWGGVGEPPVAPVAPALCNALFAATGHRSRALPLKHESLKPRR
jgi:isoquinoline 1-oxidoreductase subunit beta